MTAPIYRVEVQVRSEGEMALPSGIVGLKTCRATRLFFLQGDLTRDDVERVSRELLADPVTETFTIDTPGTADHTIDVTLLPGVTDPAAENLLRAAHLLGIANLERAATGQGYLLSGNLAETDLKKLANGVFSNPVIQRFAIDEAISPPFFAYQPANDTVEIIPVRVSDDDLLKLSAERRLSLNLEEMQAIRAYYEQENRDPSDAELEMLAQTWSEHCVHKTFKAVIDYTGPDGQQTIDGILKTYIRAATEKVNKPWVRSAFVDNAGIVAFDDNFDIAFKVETHNRPAAIEPFGGANTGLGGVIRDVLGVSARPIANTDILCFGPPDLPESELQPSVLHPRRIAEGVVSGIEDYGNKMGIPTVNGAILYHKGYTSNPLVFCGCLGLLPRDSHRTGAQLGDLIVVIGGRTGRDGLRGATFSSMEIDQTTSVVSGSAVQIGHPIHEKQVMEAVLRARDENLYHAITDCGAGGLSSAVGEMGAQVGARVQLQDVPLKYPGLRPWEIWLSEAQERMVLAVPPGNWDRVKAICDGQDIEGVSIGTFDGSGRLSLYYGEKLVGDLSMDFLHDGIPQRQMQAVWEKPSSPTPSERGDENVEMPDFEEALLKLLMHPNIRSKENVIRRYDHEVQAGTAIKPLVGVKNNGPSDAAVIVPLDTLGVVDGTGLRPAPTKAIAISNGICPLYGEIDPYIMAWAAIDEAIRNLVAVGADPDQIAILDNFCWGNTSLPDRLGSLVRCAQGCYDAAVAYGVPFISGKDSLNNEYLGADGQRHAIPGTLLISAVSIVPDVTKTVTMDLKEPGNVLYVIGETRDEMGGSHYNLMNGISGGSIPQQNPKAMDTYRALHKAIQAGLVRSCHDVSEGGIAVALAEMCIGGQLGADADVCGPIPGLYDLKESDDVSWDLIMLMSESSRRFIVEIQPEDQEVFEGLLGDSVESVFGHVNDSGELRVNGCEADNIIRTPITALEHAWRGEISDARAHSRAPLQTPQTATSPKFDRVPSIRTTPPRVLILHANGSNRDRDAALACELAGGEPEIVHVNQLLNGDRLLTDYHMLIVPGGFSYGDDLGAGTLWALDLRHRLRGDVEKFIQQGRPVLGICNGFQALVKSGLLPGNENERSVTLARNERAQFECRWVYLQPNPNSPSLFTMGLDEPIYCPVAHGEGRIATCDAAACDTLWSNGLAALTYVDEKGGVADYPYNPNGSETSIAGLCNAAGNMLGLMPHPEDHIFPWQHPRYHRGERGMSGLRLFQNGLKYA
jgi:phosphoribosylformylglycinamidine synthase II/phosphoribosylformylglycinamidine synthase I